MKTDMCRRVALSLAFLLLAAPGAMAQQDYPSRSIRIVVPFGPGGPADVYARFVGQRLQEVFKQPVVVENKAGAGGVVGTLDAAKSPADGYTLLMMSNTQTANESLMQKKPYELMRDFVPVSPVNYSDLVFAVNPSVKAKTLAEFIALAEAEPGKLNYASSGRGTPYHLATELFRAMSGTDIMHVPYKNSGDARNGLISGQVQVMIDAVSTMAPQVSAGAAVALATTGKTRSNVMPEVQTAEEAGLPGFEASIWLGIMAPAGTPQAIVDRLNKEIVAYLKEPGVQAIWGKQGANPIIATPAQFGDFLRADIEKWRTVVTKFNISVD
jgi:tripartite-type tricarboxylate transporter receptor subunit TctC